MCCWCLRVYWTVINNLFVRIFSNIARNRPNSCRECFCCSCCYSCAATINKNSTQSDLQNDQEKSIDQIHETSSRSSVQHEYVIVDDIDANYLEIERRKIETEDYYRTVDRTTAESILIGREDGTCLVRPYKETDIFIKYIVTIYAQEEFYHLFIRQVEGNRGLYAIGQPKPNERLFLTPNDIVDFYKHHHLLCINKRSTQSVLLKPIVF